jgi:hypothetical protein
MTSKMKLLSKLAITLRGPRPFIVQQSTRTKGTGAHGDHSAKARRRQNKADMRATQRGSWSAGD